MAASKERMVSSGRSHRLRVGFERSGSAELFHSQSIIPNSEEGSVPTYWISIGIEMNDGSQRRQQ
jgi:hypothetical protein